MANKVVELNSADIVNINEKCNTINDIPVCANLSYNDFFKDYIAQNIPCIIQNVTVNWICSSKWIMDGKPNMKYLLSKYQNSIVSVSNCALSVTSAECKQNISFKEYASVYYKCVDDDDNVWYLKDWHLKREDPEELFYSVPQYFASDWLNEYATDNNLDDFMFVYIGPKGSWTPFHADVYSSFSWSANVVGKKRWLLFPPGEEEQFLDVFGNLPQDVEPHLAGQNLNYFDIIQNRGEAIFVPSGWYHQVFNLEDTISINHNWVNGSNIHIMWKALVKNLVMVEKEIEEFKESSNWEDDCQVMLKALFGLNYNDFFDFITYLAKKRLLFYEEGTKIMFQDWTFGENHISFDLSAIKCILEIMVNDTHYSEFEQTELNEIINNINSLQCK